MPRTPDFAGGYDMSHIGPTTSGPVLPARRREAAQAQLEELIMQSAARPRWRRRPIIVAGFAAIALSTGAAAYAVAAHQPVTDKSQARCYAVADANSSRYTTVAEATPHGNGEIANAVSTCASLYRQGIMKLGQGIVPGATGTGHDKVPPLVACTRSDGTAAVFPGRHGTCAALGLPDATR
jgi:hypothetical protein